MAQQSASKTLKMACEKDARFDAPSGKTGGIIGFCSQGHAPTDVHVLRDAPKAAGHLMRSECEKAGGVPCLLAIFQNPSGKARNIGLAWARRIAGARSGVIETTFKNECETDVFGEQAVL